MANKVRERREELGKTQDWLADKVGISRRYVIKIEKEQVNPSVELAKKIAHWLGRLVEEIFV